MGRSTEEVGLMYGPNPLDEDDMTGDVVATVLRHRLGSCNPAVDEISRDIVASLRAYEIHKLEQLVA